MLLDTWFDLYLNEKVWSFLSWVLGVVWVRRRRGKSFYGLNTCSLLSLSINVFNTYENWTILTNIVIKMCLYKVCNVSVSFKWLDLLFELNSLNTLSLIILFDDLPPKVEYFVIFIDLVNAVNRWNFPWLNNFVKFCQISEITNFPNFFFYTMK